MARKFSSKIRPSRFGATDLESRPGEGWNLDPSGKMRYAKSGVGVHTGWEHR